MNEVKLPALTGDSALGVLASIGVLRLLSEFTEDAPLLRWEPQTLTAVLCGRRDSLDAVLVDLESIVGRMAGGSVLPGVAAGFPPPGAAPDGLRVPQRRLAEFKDSHIKQMTAVESGEALRWLASLVTDLVADDDGRVAISQYAAPSGRQSMATMLEKPLEQIVLEPDYLRQALVGWRRVPGVTGEYLDHRGMWDSAEDGLGRRGQMRGVPGATWLALMSYPLFRTTASRWGRPLSSGWHVTGRRADDELRLPIWEQALGPAGVVALIEHPVFATIGQRAGHTSNQGELAALGVLHVCRARREPGKKSTGVLIPVRS